MNGMMPHAMKVAVLKFVLLIVCKGTFYVFQSDVIE